MPQYDCDGNSDRCAALVELSGRFDTLEQTFDLRMNAVEHKIEDLDHELSGNGKIGVRMLITNFITMYTTRTEEQEKQRKARDKEAKDEMELRHQENVDKLGEVSMQIGRKTLIWNIAGVFLALAALVVTCLGIWLGARLAHTSDLRYLFTSEYAPSIYALERQTTGIPRNP
jgi:hypothetical protein